MATALGALVVGPDELATFVTEVLPQSSRWRVGLGNLSLLSLAAWLGLPALGWALVVGTALATVPGLVRRPGSPDRVFVVLVAASLLMSPLGWSYYFLFAAPCVVVLAGHLALTHARERITLYALILPLFAWPSLLGAWSEGWLRWAPFPLQVALTFVPTGALAALVWMGMARVDGRSRPRRPPRTAESPAQPRP
jgi:hypothetical protein